jgi:hypothetical protein
MSASHNVSIKVPIILILIEILTATPVAGRNASVTVAIVLMSELSLNAACDVLKLRTLSR